jgi:branched-chain amino acid transport system ATP-binding protein
VRFGGVMALNGVSRTVSKGQICGLIGPNGSGKTTLFNCISGLYAYSRGRIGFDGRGLAGVRRHRMAGLGIGRTFQNNALFHGLSVRDNVLAGAYHRGRGGFVANALRLPAAVREEADASGRLADVLELVGLGAVAEMRVTALPFATQKRVELARALIGRPKLLLLDEPAGGLNHAEVGDLERLLRRLHIECRLSILLVEHHMSLVMRVSDKVVVLEQGAVIADGSPDQVCRDPAVIRAYLGEGAFAGAA